MGARISLLRYVQAFVLHNALGGALKPTAACLAIGIRTPQGVSAILRRLAKVDPGLRFAIADVALARALYPAGPEAQASNTFLAFCQANSIMVDEERFMHSLRLAIATRVPELLARYKARGQRHRDPDKPGETRLAGPSSMLLQPNAKLVHSTNHDVESRKAAALQWQRAFAEIVPHASSRLRTKLAWRLANLQIDSREGFASMQPELLFHTSTNPSAFIKLREQYFRDLAKLLALKQAILKRAAEQGKVGTMTVISLVARDGAPTISTS